MPTMVHSYTWVGAKYPHPWWCKTPKPVMVQDTQTCDGARHPNPWWCKTLKTRDGAEHQNPWWCKTPKPVLADDTTLHTSGKDIMQIRSKMQHSLDQVSNWCDNNHMVINPIKTKKYKKTTTNVCSCTRSSAMRPQGTYLTCTYTLPHAIPVLGTITLVCLGQG